MNKLLTKSLLLVAFFAFTGVSTFAQKAVENLKVERLMLIKDGKSTREIDKQLLELNTRMPARISVTLVDGMRVVEFPFLYGNNPQELEKYQIKFNRSGLPGFLSLKVEPTTYVCTAQFKSETSDDDLRRFFLTQGYEGFQIISEKKF